MGILGTALFLLIFLMLVPANREQAGHALGAAAELIGKWAPYSYGALLLALILPVAVVVSVMKRPGTPEAEDPLARFKAEDTLD